MASQRAGPNGGKLDYAADLSGTGGTAVADGVSYLRAIVAEAVGTFLLVLAIFALAVDQRAPDPSASPRRTRRSCWAPRS